MMAFVEAKSWPPEASVQPFEETRQFKAFDSCFPIVVEYRRCVLEYIVAPSKDLQDIGFGGDTDHIAGSFMKRGRSEGTSK